MVKEVIQPKFDEVDCTKVAVSHVVGPGGNTIKEIQ
jgi:hypothetical protein